MRIVYGEELEHFRWMNNDVNIGVTKENLQSFIVDE